MRFEIENRRKQKNHQIPIEVDELEKINICEYFLLINHFPKSIFKLRNSFS